MPRLRQIAPGVLVATSELLSCTSTVVVGHDGGCLVIDPAVSVADLAALAAELAGAGLTPLLGFATHPHWDHVLWSRELGEVPRYAAPTAVRCAQTQRDNLVAELMGSAPGHDLQLFGRLTPLPPGAGQLPWPGPVTRLIVHDGHAPGHGALFVPTIGLLVAGDMLSDIEIPLLDLGAADPLGDYRAGLDLLAALPGVRWVVPGHGSVGDAAEFRRRLAADRNYLDLLAAGRPFDDPRCTAEWQQECHASQLRRLSVSRQTAPGLRRVRDLGHEVGRGLHAGPPD